MINYKNVEVVVEEPISKTCDICKKTVDHGELDFQEFHHIEFTGGYSSIFGDMATIVCDVCQDCLMTMIGNHCYYETEDGLKKFKD